ncbi:putative Trypsin-like peptidase domain-containing protein [uncultured Thiomicrorhabdus sp.]
MKKFLLLLLLPIQLACASAENSTVKIFVSKSLPDYELPWQTKKISRSSGSGVFVQIEQQNYILTSAHVIGHATFIEVRKNHNIRKFPAKVKWVSNATDLALLEVDNRDFFEDIEPLELGDLPKMGEQVTALGFPMGGDELSTTKGVVSRLEHRHYSYSKQPFLTIQIDTPINPGNSGGPIINQQQKIVGIAMQGITKANNISYLVPSRVIRHFFKDIADGEYQGMPHENFLFTQMENPTLQRYFQLPEMASGILIEEVNSSDSPLQENDVLIEVSGQKIENDGMVFLPEGKLSFKELLHQKQIGESISIKVLRQGQMMTMDWNLAGEQSNLPRLFSDKPQFHLFGGLMLVPLSQNILEALIQSNNRKNIITAANLQSYANQHPQQKEIVVLQQILPNAQNAGYRAAYSVIESLNKQKVSSFEQIVQALQASTTQPIVLKTHDDRTIVLDPQQAKNGDALIRQQYGI